MCKLRFIIFSFLLVTFVGAADVFASTHHHEGHDHSIASPFDKKQEGKSAHCILNNHQHNGGYCPHSDLPSSNDSAQRISVDCGGKTAGTIPSFSFHKDNVDNNYSIAGLSNNSFKLVAGNFLTTQQDLNSQDPPPEVL